LIALISTLTSTTGRPWTALLNSKNLTSIKSSNLFKDLLASLPHVPERQWCHWDIASFVTATAALTLSTYNTVPISKLETAIEAQQQQTDLLADIVRLHEQHLHKLDEMIEDIGNEIQKLKVQAGFHSF
jgi:hypothetical protein